MEKLGRKECSIIMKTRSQMIPCKNNMKTSNPNLMCRFCRDENKTEDQEHILQNCTVTKEKGLNIEYKDIFSENDIINLKESTKKINEIITLLT